MTTVTRRPDVASVLQGLKDFQRESVEYVFRRLYLDGDATSRFLIADEVGLGKTLVARGVIARAIDYLWDLQDRIDIIYICSNSDIARQNINRLNVTPQAEFALASRITLLPTELRNLQKNRLNFVSLTPGTSFELKSSLGTQEERVLLYWLLEEAWGLKGAGPLNVLQGNASKENFRYLIRTFHDEARIDAPLAEEFARALEGAVAFDRREGRRDIRNRFGDLCQRFSWSRVHIPPEDREDRKQLVGELRDLLAVTCLHALEPDLVILDEFQRFKHLLDGRDPASGLARKLFEYPDVRVLLLSATPYKMYTLVDEASEDDHYVDFVRTLSFLQNAPEEMATFEQQIAEYRRELFRLGDGDHARLLHLKRDIETRLRRVMVRTERLAVTEDRDGMLTQAPSDSVKLEPRDLESYLALQAVARVLKQGDTLEYWKSAPYLLNFMDAYELKRAVTEACSIPERQKSLARVLAERPTGLLAWGDIARYEEVDPANARLRALLAETIGRGAWRLLWIPPSLLYYRLEGPFADPALQGLTKRLVFSSWRVVPRVVAPLLSYAAERHMVRSFEEEPENSPEARKRRAPLLRFARADGRLTGMPVLGLLYPSSTLARECDPLILLRESGPGDLPTAADLLEHARRRIEDLLSPLAGPSPPASAPEDESWYWAAPILLDLVHDGEASREWFQRAELPSIWSGETDVTEADGEPSLWSAHVEQAAGLLSGQHRLGARPADLSLVLAQLAVAAPGVAALRALSRVCGGREMLSRLSLRDAAAAVAWSFRNLFNLAEVMALIRGMNHEEPYWRRVLEYCLAGGLQPTLDEYAHVLRESLGLLYTSPDETSVAISQAIRKALSLRAVTLGMDELLVSESADAVTLESHRMRARFALRFGADKVEGGTEETRTDQVREAFNSPFWPLVLVTTSIGQEGLDFHPYCHAVVHWNLPSNPVDLEQREGRVHRYKGHAVRRNLARRYGSMAPASDGGDPWELMFALAVRDRALATSDLVPFWVYPLKDGAKIERHVLALPLSHDLERLAALRRSLAIYRMIFGQPRQEDLVAYLLARFDKKEVARITQELRIDLSPPRLTDGGWGQ